MKLRKAWRVEMRVNTTREDTIAIDCLSDKRGTGGGDGVDINETTAFKVTE